ncbi:pentatricopeptide repeat-containing protein At4g16390, chloroplastic-like [Abrus precatorius]|uniref:Pentatricopeptide repeat-containing protein At4g16390, chloroplastic-like n=1 Tax=Abrus precatorius TaxID=3816 RepID=A0A8B8K494_ABRPR|nr:pentatricopeptide repeat-containing protein At4g16390, chloroplastic-like [Abrus precatorius]
MASNICSSHPALFHDRQYVSNPISSSSSSLLNFKVLNVTSSHKRHVLQCKTFLHPNTHASQQEADSHDPDANSSPLSKDCIWVNPNSPRAKHLRRKSSTARYISLTRLTESLNSCNPSEQHVSTILKGLGDKVSERDAMFILDKMVNSETAPFVLRHFQNKIKPFRGKEVILYNVTLKVFRKSRDFGGAEKLFDEMLQRGVKPDNITFSTMINCARMSALPNKAVEWFEKMPSFGCEPDDITCSAMVYAYARTNNVDMALSLYDRAKAKKWRLDAATFSALIKMYGMLGKYDECLKIYQEMKVLGAKPTVATYNTLLGGMFRAKRPRQVKTIYEEMRSNGVSADFITYAYLLRVYAKAQFSEDALGVYKEIKGNGMDMSADLYNMLLAMCADVGCIDEAVEIFEDMKSSGKCQPDSWTFSSLITLYSCNGKVSEAEGMLNEMIQSGFQPTIFVLTSLVQCYGKAKRTDDVVKIFKQLFDLGIVPDIRFCCCLLNVMTQTPKEELGKLTNCIDKANTKLGSVVRNLVQEQEGDEDFRKEASELLNSIDADVKKPLCNCLIDLCVNLNVPDRAGDLLDLGLTLEIYTNIQSKSQAQWCLHLKELSVGAAMTALHVWINDLSKALESGEDLPPLLGINTGQGKHKYSDKGLASVLESHLKKLNAPFPEATDKAGWFLVTKVAAQSWLESRGSTKSVADLNSMVEGVPTMVLQHR